MKMKIPVLVMYGLAAATVMAPLGGAWGAAPDAASARRVWKFGFGPGKAKGGYVSVLPTTLYTSERGYGFVAGGPTIQEVDRGGHGHLDGSFCTAEKPFFFTLDLPEGNYDVRVVLGDPKGESTTTLKAEARRLMLENIRTDPGKLATRAFTVNFHTTRLKSGSTVQKASGPDWDDRLTLEFSGARPCVDAVTITPAEDAITVFIAGDSTVCDQAHEPWAAWGQMLPRFLRRGAAVANYAESGLSLRSFTGTRRLEKVTDEIKAGDYLLIQFGHNDQKEKGEGVGAFTTYKADLERFIAMAREHGATPVLVTSMNRRNFDAAGRVFNTLGMYPDAVRQTAAEEKVPLIDLNAMSKVFYEAMGPEGSRKAFVQYPAGTFPGQEKELKDNTHFNDYGAYELAKCIVEGIKTNVSALAHFLAPDVPSFDPAHPDPVENWTLPLDSAISTTKPAGN